MGIGFSIFAFAVGAILTFAVHSSPSSFSLTTIGVIFMLVGVIGFLTALYMERNRRHLVEESIEAGTGQESIDYDDDIFVEPEGPPHRRPVRHPHQDD